MNGLFCLLGIVATIIVGKLGVKRKVITNYCTNKFSIGKKLKDEFGKIEISYDNKIITNELKVYKGIIMNTGSEDIDNIPESGIVMKCPDNWVIKDRIIGNHSKNIKITCEKGNDDSETRFKPDMLKKGEAFSYSILFEVNEIENLDESKSRKKVKSDIEFFDRIKDTTIKMENIPLSRGEYRKHLSRFYIILVAVISILIGLIYIYPDTLTLDVIENRTGETKLAGFSKDGDYVIADNEWSLLWSRTIVKEQEFNKFYSVSIIKQEETMMYILLLIYLITFLAFWYNSYDKQKKIKLLSSFESESVSNNNGDV